MKKIAIMFLVLFFPLIINAKENVYIDSVELYKNDNVKVLGEAKFNDLNLDLDLKFSEVGSSITYKLNIVNNTKVDYELSNFNINDDSEYINYNLTCDDNNKIIKHNKSKMCYIKISYEKPVSFALLKASSNKINEEKTYSIDLSKVEITNPKTGYLNIGLLLIAIIIASLLMNKYANKKTIITNYIILISLCMLIPISINAVEKITINVNSNIEISDNKIRCSHTPKNLREFIMCEIETNIHEFYKEQIENIIEQSKTDSSITEDMIKDAKELLADLEKMISMLDWDYVIETKLDYDNYKKYPDGIYTKTGVFIPFLKEASYSSLRGFSFLKPTKSSPITHYMPFIDEELVRGEKISSTSMDVKIPSVFDFKITDDTNPDKKYEGFSYTIDLQTDLKLENGEYKFGKRWNGEIRELDKEGRLISE